jgi:hypothetical protein
MPVRPSLAIAAGVAAIFRVVPVLYLLSANFHATQSPLKGHYKATIIAARSDITKNRPAMKRNGFAKNYLLLYCKNGLTTKVYSALVLVHRHRLCVLIQSDSVSACGSGCLKITAATTRPLYGSHSTKCVYATTYVFIIKSPPCITC